MLRRGSTDSRLRRLPDVGRTMDTEAISLGAERGPGVGVEANGCRMEPAHKAY